MFGDFLHIVALALIQGVTEFLPISSSAHLILLSQLLGWPDQGLTFDVAVHLGSLVAAITYFRRDLMACATGLFEALASRQNNEDAYFAFKLALATTPIAIAGILLKPLVGTNLRSAVVIAMTTLGFGLLLGIADLRKQKSTGEENRQVSYLQAFIIGCLQIFALIPGVSRSGVTITGGLLLGIGRVTAARFSFLLSIPTILASGVLTVWHELPTISADSAATFLLGFVISAASAYLCIDLFIRWIEKIGMLPFVVYRIALGLIIFAFT